MDLFVGVPLFIGKTDASKPVDLFKSEPVHAPIPNIWWLENKLDPGFADSPQRDPDGDGFSNLQEFEAKTDPNDSQSHPALVNKLKFVKDESVKWILRPGFESGGGFSFKYSDDKNNTASSGTDVVMPNGVFFAVDKKNTPNAQNRFKFVSFEKRKVKHEKFGSEEEVTFLKIEDQRGNKKGVVYELPSPLNEANAAKFAQYDRTAVLSLEAVGEEGKQFKVEEKTSFALPPNAAEKSYFIQEISPESITVEYTGPGGAKQTVKIPKG
ncbi:MAG: thrombospondin type 3 repeat-containing protein [Luteolibacter sp.]